MTIRNICIFGAGALGGSFATRIAAALGDEVNVSVVARGAHLAAIREHGFSVQVDDETPFKARVTATDDPSTLPKQDLVITGLKGHQLGDAAESLASLLKDDTRVVMVLNGIPWWYFHRDADSGFAERQLEQLDPGGKLWSLIGPQRVIGCVAYQGAEVVEPGKIRLNGHGRFILGEPSGEMSTELAAISDIFTRSGLNIAQSPRIRDEIWGKLMGNAAFNPISALTRAVMSDLVNFPALFAMVGKVMTEVQAVSRALGATFSGTVEERLEGSRRFGSSRTSMLQDLLAKKPLEILPLNGMVVEMGHLTGIPVPTCETLYALTAQLDRENRRD